MPLKEQIGAIAKYWDGLWSPMGARGVYGGYEDYRYSPALKRSGLTWTVDSLDTFIADPQASVPGNRMPYDGMHDARDRVDLIAYLQK